MADTDFNSAPNSSDVSDSSGVPKPHVYDLLNRLNAAFARVHRNMEALEQVGIFDPLMMQVLNRQSEQLRAGRTTICWGPCAALKNATASDSHSHPMRKSQTPKQRTRRKAGFVVSQSGG